MESRRWGSLSRVAYPVRVNIYDLHECNESLRAVGIGLYHSGVEVHGKEWAYSARNGVFAHTPQKPPGAVTAGVTLHSTIEVGETSASPLDVDSICRKLESSLFPPKRYQIIQNNCNHFSNALCVELTGHGIPSRVNRIAGCASSCGDCIPSLIGAEIQVPASVHSAVGSVPSQVMQREGSEEGYFYGRGRSVSEDRPDMPLDSAGIRDARIRHFSHPRETYEPGLGSVPYGEECDAHYQNCECQGACRCNQPASYSKGTGHSKTE
mmetsp:Transcript_23941/g.54016  ORF Transcript_23941/g.54016 Transcript_23941/m.54016 type:complete len:266 (-) Transcript_23941:165-962(-)|eukprot:CAMPEP_0172649484 /NCGR_PEP_ID=MMETSP1068-20121228/241812_1 /TAXON_ID=35684 /ORGANISM="Pseudopedinella elastica, Strain CCMP716" /LENGTH=265 /DNA_ID=CAMNT_0013463839 /DNA_START=95 /DNA_END=892 /DNA_ORIENTATION=-